MTIAVPGATGMVGSRAITEAGARGRATHEALAGSASDGAADAAVLIVWTTPLAPTADRGSAPRIWPSPWSTNPRSLHGDRSVALDLAWPVHSEYLTGCTARREAISRRLMAPTLLKRVSTRQADVTRALK
jgi:hypothetical protein